jgi:hypothetical protein
VILESLIKRAEGSFITIGNDIYHFFNHIPGDPRHLCEVKDDDHIQTLLGIKEGFKIAKRLPQAQGVVGQAKQGKANAKAPAPAAIEAPGIGDGADEGSDAEGGDETQPTDANAAK